MQIFFIIILSVMPDIVHTPESHSDVSFYLEVSYSHLLPHIYISLHTANLILKNICKYDIVFTDVLPVCP